MYRFDRRQFIKMMGQCSAVLCMGLSQKKASAQTGGATAKNRPKRIAVEEHIVWGKYPDEPKKRESDPAWTPGEKVPMEQMSVIGDIANIDLRLKDMDATGIDMQVISWSGGGEGLVSQEGITQAKRHNDKLAEVVNRYPERFGGFSMLPWQEPSVAVSEVERTVKELGLKGPKVGPYLDNGDRLDDKKYWPVFEKINELDVPMFIHPRNAHPDAAELYEGYPQLTAKMWGYSADVCLAAMRLILSGLFDEYPRLKIVLGHMGEGLPFYIWRVSSGMGGPVAPVAPDGTGSQGPPGVQGGPGGPMGLGASGGPQLKKQVGDYIKENFYAATSGNFFHPALICSYMAMPENVLFGVDWPPESNSEAVEFMETAPILSDNDKEKIYHLNAERIFNI
jgi:2,3-dihydroxybenzoate decarboxylase